MKRVLALGTMLLGGCLALAAQSTPQQTQSTTPQGSTPSTFPQDQTTPPPASSTSPADPSAIPPDSNAPGRTAQEQSSQAAGSQQISSVEGCLSQSSDGNFVIADNSGNSFQLKGETSQLNSYVGKQVHVDGAAVADSGNTAGAMASSSDSSNTGSSSSSARQFTVSSVKKISDSCGSVNNTK